MIFPSPARENQLNFRFYRSPQRAKYSACIARSWKTNPADWFSHPHPACGLSNGGCAERAGVWGIRSLGTDSMSAPLLLPYGRSYAAGAGNGGQKRRTAFLMSGHRPRRVLLAAASAFNLFFVDSGFGRNQLGEFRALALILSAHSAGTRIVTYGPERDSGRCPENPQPFEKGWRKLHLGLRCFPQLRFFNPRQEVFFYAR